MQFDDLFWQVLRIMVKNSLKAYAGMSSFIGENNKSIKGNKKEF